MPSLLDLTDRTYGRLTVIERAPNIGRYVSWLCLCKCGTRVVVKGLCLKGKLHKTASCGCLRRETAALIGRQLQLRHGHAIDLCSREYRSWSAAKARCYRKNDIGYNNYGGRGITVCERWRRSFEAFLADMGTRPPNTSLDRIDVNGNYDPSNCRWATPKQQAENKRKRAA